jgi:hypothetical protein
VAGLEVGELPGRGVDGEGLEPPSVGVGERQLGLRGEVVHSARSPASRLATRLR